MSPSLITVPSSSLRPSQRLTTQAGAEKCQESNPHPDLRDQLPWNLYPDRHKSQAHQVPDCGFFPALAILSSAQGGVRQLAGEVTSSPLLHRAGSGQRQNPCLWQRIPAEPGLVPTLPPTSPSSTPCIDESLWYLTGSHHQLGEVYGPSAFLLLTLLQPSQHVRTCGPSRTPQIPFSVYCAPTVSRPSLYPVFIVSRPSLYPLFTTSC